MQRANIAKTVNSPPPRGFLCGGGGGQGPCGSIDTSPNKLYAFFIFVFFTKNK